MSLLISQKILDRIRDELAQSTESFLFISAYCKLPLIEFFNSSILDTAIEKKLVVRFRPDDILSGASDLEIYPYCKQHGWKLYFRLDLHAKTYIFDNLRCIVGSANATNSGLSFHNPGNYEIATICTLEANDVLSLEQLIRGSVEMNDNIYDQMQHFLANHITHSPNLQWPQPIADLFVPDYSILFTEDFPLCSHPNEANFDDLAFLDLPCPVSSGAISLAFRHAKCFRWLIDLLEKQNPKEMYFGAVTVALHNTLLNEPKPYRREVKELLSNLLNWIVDLDMPEFKIDRPSHSQRIRYVGGLITTHTL